MIYVHSKKQYKIKSVFGLDYFSEEVSKEKAFVE